MFPGQVKQELQVIELETILSNLWIDPTDLCDLAIECILYGLAPFLFLAAFHKVADLCLLWVLSKFFLDRLQLLIEEVITLLLFDIHPHFRFELALDLKHLHFVVHQLEDFSREVVETFDLEQFLLAYIIDPKIGRDKSKEMDITLDIADHHYGFGWDIWRQLYNLLSEITDRTHDRFKFHLGFGRDIIACIDPGDHIRINRVHLDHIEP